MRAFTLALSAILISPVIALSAIDQKTCATEATHLLADQDSKAPVSFDENGKTIKGKPADIVTSRKIGKGQGEEVTYILKIGPENMVLKKVRNKTIIERNEGVLSQVTRIHNPHDEFEMVNKDKSRPIRYETSLQMSVDAGTCVVNQNLAQEAPWNTKPKDRKTVVYYDRTLCANLQPILKEQAKNYETCANEEYSTTEKYKKDCSTLNNEMMKVFLDRTGEMRAKNQTLKTMSPKAQPGTTDFIPEMYGYTAVCKQRYMEINQK
jgi:hypothetical protein